MTSSLKLNLSSIGLFFWVAVFGLLSTFSVRAQSQYSAVSSAMGSSIVAPSANGGIASSSGIMVNGIPVNLYRGVASPTVSLASMQGKELSTSVALGYDGQGVRVASVASEVGTGWGLAAGGAISCEVQDEPDENRARSIDWLRVLQYKPGGNGLERTYQEYMCRFGVKEYDDTEYDVFRLTVNGLQARFLIKDGVVFVLDNPRLIITPVFVTGSQYRINSFIVTDDGGIKYYFDEKATAQVTTTSYRVGNSQTEPTHTNTYTSQWLLTRIVAANSEVFSFLYQAWQKSPVVENTHYTEYSGLYRNAVRLPNQTPVVYRSVTRVNMLSPRKLWRIESSVGSIEFFRQMPRKDLDDDALTCILVKNIEQRVISQTRFVYSYFISPGAGQPSQQNSRLRLDKVVQLAEGCAADVTRFTYHQSGDVGRESFQQDYYGFYNANSANTLLPPVLGEPQLVSANRTSDLSKIVNCALERIDYGSGSSVNFEYELHGDGSASNNAYGSGLRIRRIVAHDGNGRYQSEEITYSLNHSCQIPKCFDFRLFRLVGNVFNACDPNGFVTVTSLFRSSVPVSTQPNDLYGYQIVGVIHQNGSKTEYKFTSLYEYNDTYNANSTKQQVFVLNRTPLGGGDMNGNMCYDFSFDPEWIFHNFPQLQSPSFCLDVYGYRFRGMYPTLGPEERPYGVKNDRSVYRGVLLRQRDIASDGTTVIREVVNDYNFPTFTADIGAVSARIGFEQDYSGGGSRIYNYYYNIKFYTRSQAWVRLDRQTVTLRDQNNPAFASATGTVSTVTEYDYRIVNPTPCYLPRAVRSYVASDPTRVTVQRTIRPADFESYVNGTSLPPGPPPGTFVEALVQRNMLSTPIEEYTYDQNVSQINFKSSKLLTYREENGRILPNQVFAWNACSGVLCPSFSEVSAVMQADGSWSIAKDRNYRLISTASRYDAAGNPINAETSDGIKQSQVWGYNSSTPIASVVNATTGTDDTSLPSNAGHTSFEYGTSSDRWPTAVRYSAEAKTGVRSAELSKPTAEYSPSKVFTISPDQQRGRMLFSCWAKVPSSSNNTASFNVVIELQQSDGTRLRWTGPGFSTNPNQPWKFCRAEIDFDAANIRALMPTSGNVRINCYVWLSGLYPVLVDEFRVHPGHARMTSQTLIPGIGKTSETDANNVTRYLEYDANNRPSLVKDEAGNIIKRMVYHQAAEQTPLTLNASHSRPIRDEPVSFMAEVLECGTVSYYWNFGDGATHKTSATPVHTYAQAGTYTVRVVADNPERGPVETSMVINVVAPLSADLRQISGNPYFDICDGPPSPTCTIQAVPIDGCSASFSYRWETRSRFRPTHNWGGWNNLPGAIADVLTIGHDVVGSKQYRCAITDACGRTVDTYEFEVTTVNSANCPEI